MDGAGICNGHSDTGIAAPDQLHPGNTASASLVGREVELGNHQDLGACELVQPDVAGFACLTEEFEGAPEKDRILERLTLHSEGGPALVFEQVGN